MKTAADDQTLAYVLKALSSPVRLQIVRFVASHPGCICNQIVIAIGKAQPTISQHLRILRASGIVAAEDEGAATAYCLNPERLAWLREQVGDFCRPCTHP